MFTLSITLGNDAMQTPEDVAAALRKVIERLESECIAAGIYDGNGNRVGEWEFKPESDTDTE